MNNQSTFKLLKIIPIVIGILFTNITFAFDLYEEETQNSLYNSENSKETHKKKEHKKSKHHKSTNKHAHKKKAKTNNKRNKETHEHRNHHTEKHKHKKT